MGLSRFIIADIRANKRNPKGIVIALSYRLAHSTLGFPFYLLPIRWLIVAFYKLITEYVIGTEIHWRASIGSQLTVFHGYGLVIHSDTKIGRGAVLRHGVTIGKKSPDFGAPVIGDFVEFGAGAIVIGAVHIGDRCVIGAGAVVTKSIPANTTVAGNPAQIIHTKRSML